MALPSRSSGAAKYRPNAETSGEPRWEVVLCLSRKVVYVNDLPVDHGSAGYIITVNGSRLITLGNWD